MTRDEITSIAREAGIIDRSPAVKVGPAMMNALGNFFALAYEEGAKAEREACAKACQGVVDGGKYDGWQQYAAAACRDEIRARGEKGQS